MNKIFIKSFYILALLGIGINNAYATPTTTTPPSSEEPPVVYITSPANQSRYTAGANISIIASASQVDGSISEVVFYNGATLLRTVTSSPYTYMWNNVAAGTYNLTAVATDNTGLSSTSSVVRVIVNLATVSPAITTQPTSQTVIAPATATFSCAASGNPTPTYQWQVSTNGGTTYSSISGATNASYTTPATSSANNGTEYECVATNTAGSATSTAATMNVDYAPVITTQPTSQTVSAPATATFSCAASGNPTPTYQWQVSTNGGSTYSSISGATNASYTTPATSSANNGTQYECVATNTAGSTTSTAATLSVNYAPLITTQPASQTVASGNLVIFNCVAGGNPTPTYQWQVSSNGGTTYTPISGATSPSFTINEVLGTNNGMEYECVATNTAGSAISNAAVLTISYGVSFSSLGSGNITCSSGGSNCTPACSFVGRQLICAMSSQIIAGASVTFTATPYSGSTFAGWGTGACASVGTTSNVCTVTINSNTGVTANFVSSVVPSITTQPVDVTVSAPTTATFTVAASGTPAPTYQWMQSVNGGTFTSIAEATSASYTTPATTGANSGTQYECVATNTAGSVTSNAVTLTVNAAPSITTQSVNATVTAPATATFTIVATGSPAPTYQWMQEASGAGTFTAITGATSASYTTPATTAANNGTQYECVVTNNAGSVTSNAAVLTVNGGTAAFINTDTTTQGNWATAYGNDGYYIASSVSQAPSYASFSLSGGSLVTWAASTTDIRALETPSGGRIASAYQSSGSFTIDVNITDGNTHQVSLYLLDWDNWGPRNETVQAIDPSTNTVLNTNNVASFYTAGRYLVYNVSGHVQFVVTNNVGGRSAVVSGVFFGNTFTAIPSITTQPVNATITAPATATFSVVANNTPAYQWMQEAFGAGIFTAITGATSASYTTPATTTANSATQYECVVSDLAGSVTSNVVSLTVNPASPPVVAIISPTNNSTLTTGSINITAFASENYGSISNVKFYNGASLLGTVAGPGLGGTGASQAYTYPWTNITAGTYQLTAVATDISGVATTSLPITITINFATFTHAVDDNIASKTDARGNTTGYQYDNDNRLLGTTFADTSTVSYAYDAFGNQTGITDQRGNTLTKTYDVYERLHQTQDPLNGITQFTYDTEGHLLTLTDANGHTTTYTYDPNGKVLTQTNALNFTTTYTYDPVGNIATRLDANNKTTNYTYDALNRLTNTAYPDSTSVANVYDAIGRKTFMTDAIGQTTYTYDVLNRLSTKTAPGTNNKITYTYDSEGNRLTSVDQNNRTITNTYDALNRLSTVHDTNGATTYGYDGDSNKISVTSPNGVKESYTYDTLNRVLTAVNAKGATGISSFTNVYDVAGMITKKTLADGSWITYSYDVLNRLLEETKQTSSSTIYDYVYTYDPVGNRLTWTKNTTLGNFWNTDSTNMPSQVLTNMTVAGFGNTATPTQTTTLARNYTYDAGNQLNNWNYAVNIYSSSFPVQTDTYTYDNNGNRLTKQAVLTGQEGTPQQTTYSYDFENRLASLGYVNIPGITGTQTDTLTYNGEGLRTQAVLNSVAANYLYDGSNILVERDGSNNTTKSYTRGLDFGGGIGSLIAQNTTTAPATAQYYDYNDLGSSSDLTTSTGTSAASYSYDAFGNLLTPQAGGDTNRYLFSMKELDSRSGLQFFGARYYDPEVGRWFSPGSFGMIEKAEEFTQVFSKFL